MLLSKTLDISFGENMSRAVGRPTKYNAEMQAQADAYVLRWAEVDAVPSRVGLCCWLGINKKTSFDWEREYPEFSATLANVDTLQERTAVNKGISGEFNSTIVKLVLANHGYSDKVQQDNVSSDGSMSPPKQVTFVVVDNDDESDG